MRWMSFDHPQKPTSGNLPAGMEELTKISPIQSIARILNLMLEDTPYPMDYQADPDVRKARPEEIQGYRGWLLSPAVRWRRTGGNILQFIAILSRPMTMYL